MTTAQAHNTGADEAEALIQASIDNSPQPLKDLGNLLCGLLDEDQWKRAEGLMLALAKAGSGWTIPDGATWEVGPETEGEWAGAFVAKIKFVDRLQSLAFLDAMLTSAPGRPSDTTPTGPEHTLRARWAFYRSEADNAPTPTMRARSGGAADALLGLFNVFGFKLPSLSVDVAADELVSQHADLLDICQKPMPAGICITNPVWPDTTVVPVDVTMGELRQLAAAVARANSRQVGASAPDQYEPTAEAG